MTVLLLYMSDGVIDLFIGNLNQVLIKYLYGRQGAVTHGFMAGWLTVSEFVDLSQSGTI